MADIPFDAIFGFLGVVAGVALTYWLQRRKINAGAVKDEADANEQIRKTVMSLIKPLQDQVEELETELRDWKQWATELVNQIRFLGHEPVPFKSIKVKRK